jgi:tRNA 2-thiouridine synthesizing protein A
VNTVPGPDRDQRPIEVDARGLRCPLPVIRLAEAARDAPDGTWVVILASDPAARHDIPAWCRMRGHELTELREVTEASQTTEVTGVAGSSGIEEGSQATDPAYLRFVVRIRP